MFRISAVALLLAASLSAGKPKATGPSKNENQSVAITATLILDRDQIKEMLGTDLKGWMYQGDQAKDRPADLGYYLGYKICEAFYGRTPDKAEAVRRILNITAPEAFLKESGYGTGN